MRQWRADALEHLDGGDVDLVVVGAGIIGVVAYDAARTGLRVALVDAGDVGGATSSASSKLLHGGFRYLAMGSYGLVHAAQVESRVLATRIAPHLSRPLPVVLSMEPGRWPEWRLSCGLMLYFGLAGFRPPCPRLLEADEAVSIAPGCARRTRASTSCYRSSRRTTVASSWPPRSAPRAPGRSSLPTSRSSGSGGRTGGSAASSSSTA